MRARDRERRVSQTESGKRASEIASERPGERYRPKQHETRAAVDNEVQPIILLWMTVIVCTYNAPGPSPTHATLLTLLCLPQPLLYWLITLYLP